VWGHDTTIAEGHVVVVVNNKKKKKKRDEKMVSCDKNTHPMHHAVFPTFESNPRNPKSKSKKKTNKCARERKDVLQKLVV
jgi:signal recognition particle receptor subunit beta